MEPMKITEEVETSEPDVVESKSLVNINRLIFYETVQSLLKNATHEVVLNIWLHYVSHTGCLNTLLGYNSVSVKESNSWVTFLKLPQSIESLLITATDRLKLYLLQKSNKIIEEFLPAHHLYSLYDLKSLYKFLSSKSASYRKIMIFKEGVNFNCDLFNDIIDLCLPIVKMKN